MYRLATNRWNECPPTYRSLAGAYSMLFILRESYNLLLQRSTPSLCWNSCSSILSGLWCCRKVPLVAVRARWFDIPFTTDESLTADKKLTLTCKYKGIVSMLHTVVYAPVHTISRCCIMLSSKSYLSTRLTLLCNYSKTVYTNRSLMSSSAALPSAYSRCERRP